MSYIEAFVMKSLFKYKVIFFRPEDLDVKIDGQQLCVTASQDVGEGGGGRTRVFEQRSARQRLHHSLSLIF